MYRWTYSREHLPLLTVAVGVFLVLQDYFDSACALFRACFPNHFLEGSCCCRCAASTYYGIMPWLAAIDDIENIFCSQQYLHNLLCHKLHNYLAGKYEIFNLFGKATILLPARNLLFFFSTTAIRYYRNTVLLQYGTTAIRFVPTMCNMCSRKRFFRKW